MKKKKPGFTLMEMIIVVAVIVIVLAIVISMFITGNKVFYDSDVKSTLQMEAQAIQENITEIGMQASKIDEITVIDKKTLVERDIDIEENFSQLTDLFTDLNGDKLTGTAEDNEKYLNIKEITIIVREEVQGVNPADFPNIEDAYYIIKYERTSSENDSGVQRGKLTIKKQGESETVIGEDVESITIKPGTFSSKLSQADSIQFSINLAKKKGFSNVEYPIVINVAFRNKNN